MRFTVFMVFKIVLFILNIVNCQEPWDNIKISSPTDFAKDKNTDRQNTVQNNLADVFFKKHLQTIVTKGQYNEENGLFVTKLRYELEKSDYDFLKSLASTSVSLTPEEFRKVDKILLNRIREPNFFEKNTHFISVFFSNEKFYYGIIVCFIVLVMKQYFLDFIHNLMPLFINGAVLKILILLLIIGSLYIWECKLAFDNERIETLKTIYEETEKPSLFSWRYWFPANSKIRTMVDKSFYEVVHPATIFTRLSTKFIYAPLRELFDVVDSFSWKISGKLYMPLNLIAYYFLISTFGVAILTLVLTFIWAFIFNQRINFNFYGLKMGLSDGKKKKKNKTSEISANQTNHTAVTMALIELSHSILNFATQNNERPALTQAKEKKIIVPKQRSVNLADAKQKSKINNLRQRRISF